MASRQAGDAWLGKQFRREGIAWAGDSADSPPALADAIIDTVTALAELDLALAKARLAEELAAPELPHPGEAQGWIVAPTDTLHLLALWTTGLGLTLVKGMAESHGGSVKVESTAEKGTTFTVRLPKNH